MKDILSAEEIDVLLKGLAKLNDEYKAKNEKVTDDDFSLSKQEVDDLLTALSEGEFDFDELDFVQSKKVDDKLVLICQDIQNELSNSEKESKKTQDDVDLGISIGLQLALNIVKEYM